MITTHLVSKMLQINDLAVRFNKKINNWLQR
jgi:hypothetical protein